MWELNQAVCIKFLLQTGSLKNVSSFLHYSLPSFSDVSLISVVGTGNLAVGFGVATFFQGKFSLMSPYASETRSSARYWITHSIQLTRSQWALGYTEMKRQVLPSSGSWHSGENTSCGYCGIKWELFYWGLERGVQLVTEASQTNAKRIMAELNQRVQGHPMSSLSTQKSWALT